MLKLICSTHFRRSLDIVGHNADRCVGIHNRPASSFQAPHGWADDLLETDQLVVDREKVLFEGHTALLADECSKEGVVVDCAVLSVKRCAVMFGSSA